jgi:hypothetical protein
MYLGLSELDWFSVTIISFVSGGMSGFATYHILQWLKRRRARKFFDAYDLEQ